jgi:hypothetical protein
VNETARLMLMLALAGSVVTFMGSAAIWLMDPQRRMARALRRVLKGWPDAIALSPASGRGAGVSFDSGLVAVCWDSGAWCLVYRIDELAGAELKVDGEVVGRVMRDEPRRTLDRVAGALEHVTLRLVFDDPRHPDFDVDLWTAGDQLRRVAASPADAMIEANRWLARAEAILRRPRAETKVDAQPLAGSDEQEIDDLRLGPAPSAKRPPRKPADDETDELPF